MNLRKTIGLVMGLIMILAIFVGCQKEEQPEPTKAPEVKTSEAAAATPEPEPEDPYLSMENTLEISWLGNNGAAIEDENYVQKIIEEKFNVKLVNTKIDNTNEDQRNLMMSAGELPDASFMYEEAKEMFDDELIRTVPKSFLVNYAPNYAAMLDENPLGWKMYIAEGTEDEYMALTGISLNLENLTVNSIYRYDWLEKLDVVPDLDNIQQLDEEGRVFFAAQSPSFEELNEILTAFVTGDPDGDGQNDTFGFGGWNDPDKWCWSVVQGMFGFNSDHYNLMSDGTLYEWNISPEYKEFLKQMAAWYESGVLDPEFVTLNKNKWWEKITSGIIGWWASPFGYVDDEAPAFQTRPPMSLLINDPEAKILVTGPEYGPTGQRGSRQWCPVSALNYRFFIGSDVTDEELARILMIFDYINFDKEGLVLTRWGVAGEHFDWAGEEYNSKPIMREGYNFGENTGFSFYNFPIYNEAYMPYQYGDWTNKMLSYQQGEGRDLMIRPYKWDFFAETDFESVEEMYEESLDTIRDEFFFAVITGEKDVDAEWDNYVDTWMGAGGTEYMAELEKMPVVDDIRAGKYGN